MMKDDIAKTPNRIPWPPILYALALLVAWVLQSIWPAGEWLARAGAGLRGLGVIIAVAGVAMDLAAMATMHRAHTNVLPHRGAQHLMTQGVFAFSRNPIYLGNTLLMIGIALVLRWPWLLLMTLLAAVLVDRLAIRREEQHLAARFGPVFAEYTRRVPRWIGWLRRGSDPS